MAHRTASTTLGLVIALGAVSFTSLAAAQQAPGHHRRHREAQGDLLDAITRPALGWLGQAGDDEGDGDADCQGNDGDDADDDSATDDSDATTDDNAPAADDGGDTSDDGSDDGDTVTPPPNTAAQGTTWGIFVGITRYGSENHDLPGSASDAQNVARAFERAGWMQRSNAVVLTDDNATLAHVRQAFSAMAPRVGAHDTLVFFFDGHGNTSELDLRGDDLSRRELGALLDRAHGRSLVVLDSCNAGGFAGVVRGHPGRAGLFSSRADEESSTAPEVGAGGWLAWNFRRAIEGGARRRADGSVALDDVVRYVERGYQQRQLDQTLVVARGDRSEFALGGAGAGDAAAPSWDERAIARNDPRPVRRPPSWTGDLGDPFAQAMRLGTNVAGAALRAFTK